MGRPFAVQSLDPITGITLPYISQGGSSHWVTSLRFGLSYTHGLSRSYFSYFR